MPTIKITMQIKPLFVYLDMLNKVCFLSVLTIFGKLGGYKLPSCNFPGNINVILDKRFVHRLITFLVSYLWGTHSALSQQLPCLHSSDPDLQQTHLSIITEIHKNFPFINYFYSVDHLPGTREGTVELRWGGTGRGLSALLAWLQRPVPHWYTQPETEGWTEH